MDTLTELIISAKLFEYFDLVKQMNSQSKNDEFRSSKKQPSKKDQKKLEKLQKNMEMIFLTSQKLILVKNKAKGEYAN